MKSFDNIRRALEYIDCHLEDSIDFEKLAKVLHFSPYYFHHMFSMITGKTIAAHIRDRRLEQSCLQLYNTNKNILMICLDCGFNSPQSFCRSFKNKYGLSPSEYRKKKYMPIILSIDEMVARFEKQLEGSTLMSKKIMNDIEELTKKINLEPRNAEFYDARGGMYYALKKYYEAKADFIQAVEIDPENSYYLINLGNTCMWLSEFAEAAIYQTKAITFAKDEKEKTWYYSCRGSSYQHLGEYEKSLEDYNKVVELDNTKAEHYADRGNAYQWLGYHSTNRENMLNSAVSDYTKAIELQSDNYKNYGERGVCFQSLEKYHEAIKDFTMSFELNPADALYIFHKGIVCTEMGEYEKALECYNKAIEIDNMKARFFAFRGKNYIRMQKYEEAITDYRKTIEIEPLYPYFYNDQVLSYKDSIAFYTKAIKLYPEFAFFYHIRGGTYRVLGEYEKSLEDCTKAIEVEPQNPQFYIQRATTFDCMNKYDEEIRDYTKAIELDPSKSSFHELRGCIYYKLGEYEKSIEDLARVVELGAKTEYKERGRSFECIAKYPEAIQNYLKAIDPDCKDIQLYTYLGYLFRKIENYDEAVGCHTKAIENKIDPTNLIYYYSRGILYLLSKEYDKALDDFIKAIELEPENSMYYIYRLICLQWTEQINEAIKKYTEKIESDKHQSYNFYYRGVSYNLIGEFEKSVLDFKKAMENDTSNFKAFNYLTRISRDVEIIIGEDFLACETEEFINKTLFVKIKELRSEFKEKYDIDIPIIRIKDSTEVGKSEIIISVDGIIVCRFGGLLDESIESRTEKIVGVIGNLFV